VEGLCLKKVPIIIVYILKNLSNKVIIHSGYVTYQ